MAIGMTGVLIGIYLARLQFSAALIGLVVTAGLSGGAAAALLATLAADRMGRRRFLFAISVLGALGGLVVALASSAVVIAGGAFLGMLNGMGKDRGAALVVEQAILPSTASDERRTAVFTIYNVLQAAGASLGGLAAAIPALLHRLGGVPQPAAMRAAMGLYAMLMLATAALYPLLTPAVESSGSAPDRRVSAESRGVVFKLSALFSLDSLGGGFLTNALISYFFVARFGAPEGVVAMLFFGQGVANSISQFGAAFLARRFGLINTMVFTHIPGSLLLIAVALAPSFPIAAVLFLMRECLIQMDVPTRQSYVMAVVRPHERTFASGVTGLVRLGGWAVGPAFAGLFIQGLSLPTPLIAGSLLKVVYDLMLYRAFRELKPPEEQEGDRRARGH